MAETLSNMNKLDIKYIVRIEALCCSARIRADFPSGATQHDTHPSRP